MRLLCGVRQPGQAGAPLAGQSELRRGAVPELEHPREPRTVHVVADRLPHRPLVVGNDLPQSAVYRRVPWRAARGLPGRGSPGRGVWV